MSFSALLNSMNLFAFPHTVLPSKFPLSRHKNNYFNSLPTLLPLNIDAVIFLFNSVETIDNSTKTLNATI